LHSLQKILRQAGQPTRVLPFANGTRLLVLPQGGRVLGLFAPGHAGNFFWTHPALATAAGARQLLADPRWPNPGGDRTWLAPTTELFVRDLNRLWDTYREPRDIDPGNYRCVQRHGQLHLINHGRVPLYRSRGTAAVEISKTFTAAPDPLRYERAPDARVRYAGYTTTVTLRVRANPRRTDLGLWPLLQLPPDGEMILPTFHRTAPLTIFGHVPRADLLITDRLVRYRMRSRTSAKLAVRAVATTGRMGYVRTAEDGQTELVIRNFAVNPSGEYVDTPFDDLKDRGYSVQACNVAEANLGRFNEIEHHVPAVHAPGAATTDISQVWAYHGPRTAIERIIRLLLTPANFRLAG
jgi:hypothetical protein